MPAPKAVFISATAWTVSRARPGWIRSFPRGRPTMRDPGAVALKGRYAPIVRSRMTIGERQPTLDMRLRLKAMQASSTFWDRLAPFITIGRATRHPKAHRQSTASCMNG